MNAKDYINGSDPSTYGTDDWDAYAGPAPAPTPSVHANATGPVVTGNAQVSTLRPGLEAAPHRRDLGIVFGDFDAAQRCYVIPLSKLAWAFLATTAEGRTADALGLLSVYRALYNSQRAAIAPGFSAAARDALPASLPEIAWTDAMRLSMQIVLSATTGGRTDRNAVLNSMPNSVAQLGAWFASSRGAFDESAMRGYLEIPRVGGETLAASVLSVVQDDVARCLTPAPTYTVGPATGIACPPGQILVAGRCQSNVVYRPGGTAQNTGGGSGGGSGGPSQNPSGGAPARSGQGILVLVVAALAAGAWWVYREEERIAQQKRLPEKRLAGAEKDAE